MNILRSITKHLLLSTVEKAAWDPLGFMHYVSVIKFTNFSQLGMPILGVSALPHNWHCFHLLCFSVPYFFLQFLADSGDVRV